MTPGKIPPSYVDIGKQARDIFSKGYHFGQWILDCKTKTQSGIEVRTTGEHNLEAGKVLGKLETKYKYKDYGLTLTGKWNTENKLFGEASVQDQIVEGLKLGVELNLLPESGDNSAKLKASYGFENIKLDADTSLSNAEESTNVINASGVVGFEGFVIGYQTAFNIQDSSLSKHNFALGFSQDQISVHVACNDGEVFTGSVFHRTSDRLNCAVQLSCTKEFEQDGGEFSIGAKYKLDADATVGAKVSTEGQVGLSYQQRLREGITLTLSSMIEGKDFKEGAHKIGVALELES